jgi:hypothetical protein
MGVITMKKVDVYAAYDIKYNGGKIFSPVFGWIAPLLVNGNSKLGKGVWTFSTLAGNKVYTIDIGGKSFSVHGTCPCNCRGCYAQTGNYNFYSTKKSNFIKTYLSRYYLDYVKNAIIAQIHADKIKLLRIHASGDFFSVDYINMWKEIATTCSTCVFWGYTKNTTAEKSFDNIDNTNIVKSIIPGYGFNFGKCGYIIKVYNALKSAGKTVYICRCGVDKNQHCTSCKGCSQNAYVLFIEHSTGYIAENDIDFPELKSIIENQPAIN